MTPESKVNEEQERQVPRALYQQLVDRVEYRDGTLYWTKNKMPGLIGKALGTKGKQGYLRIHTMCRFLSAHRVIYFMHTGELPLMIDHIDGNPGNNRIANLRPCTFETNAKNAKFNGKNTSGAKGVYKLPSGRWQACIRVDNRLKYLGSFDDLTEARRAREAAEVIYYGEWRRAASAIQASEPIAALRSLGVEVGDA